MVTQSKANQGVESVEPDKSDEEMSDEGIGCCFDGWTGRWERRDRRKGLLRESRALRDLLAPHIQGEVTLEIGCGIGSLTRDLVKNGARRGIGMDLSPKAIETARRLSAEEGMLDRVEFHNANGAAVALPEHSVVVLDKVVCCYPEPNSLIPHSIREDTTACGLVIPISKGIIGRTIALIIKVQNFVFKMRKIDFRAFVHPQPWIDSLVQMQGLELVEREVKFPWVVSIYKRGVSDSSASLAAAAATSR